MFQMFLVLLSESSKVLLVGGHSCTSCSGTVPGFAGGHQEDLLLWVLVLRLALGLCWHS